MNLFRKSTATPEPTGIDIIRQALRTRNRTPSALALILDGGSSSTDNHVGKVEGVAKTALDAFAAGADNLSIPQLRALAKALFSHAEFDPETNLLQSSNKAPPIALGTASAPYDPKLDPRFVPFDRDRSTCAPGLVPPVPGLQQPAPRKAGWA